MFQRILVPVDLTAKSEAAVEQASELVPNSVRLHMALAELYAGAGDPAAAAERYRRTLVLDPSHVIALNNLAYDMAVREKKPADARGMARKALALAPQDASVIDTVAWIEYLLGNTAEANRMLIQAARRAPGNADVRLHNAIVLAAQGARGAAEAELAEALKLNPAFESIPDVRDLRERLAGPPK